MFGCSGPLAGRPSGFYEENGIRLLVKDSPAIIEATKGDWQLLQTYLVNLLAGPDEPWAEDQYNTFNGWLQISRRVLLLGKFQPEQALAIAGPVNSGRKLASGNYSKALGGRSAKAGLFLQGRTDFNSEFFGAEHLILEDENASISHQARSALAAGSR
jgi:hypothetical protein